MVNDIDFPFAGLTDGGRHGVRLAHNVSGMGWRREGWGCFGRDGGGAAVEAVVKLRVGVAEKWGVGEEFPGSLKNLQFVHNCIIMESHVNLWTIML